MDSAPFVVDQPSAIVSATDIATLTALVSDRYTITGELGHGGMATVYLAQDTKHSRPVALKVLRPELYSPGLAERFLSEIQVTAGLQHPHILPLFDSGSAGTLLYYVMPFVEGQTLRDRLSATPQLPVAEAIRIGSEVAGALDYAHRHGVIHRDIKPENILFQDGAALVADFGIAFSLSRASGERLTQTGFSIGTPTYMSPEQAVGERDLDARTDVYALGAVVYEMLAGTAPHTGDSAQAVLAKVLTTEPVALASLRRDVPPALAAVVMRAIAREPANRWSSASAFAAALQAPTPVGVPAATRERIAPRRLRTLGLIGLALTAIVVGAAVWRARPATRPTLTVTSKRQVTFVGNVENSAIAPDGRFLAYVTHNDDSLFVFVQEMAGGNAIPILSLDHADVESLRWSPDGTRLLITGVAGTTPVAYVVARLGGDRRALPVSSLLNDIVPMGAWLPDGQHVALWSRTTHGVFRGVRVELSTGNTSPIPLVPLGYTAQGSWSPDGKRFAISQFSDSTYEAWIVRSTGALHRLASATLAESTLADLQWLPDGRGLLALRGRSELVHLPLNEAGIQLSGPVYVLAANLEGWGIDFDERSQMTTSADAARAVYTRTVQYGNVSVQEVGRPARAITTGTTMKWNAIPSPRGDLIAYVQRGVRDNHVWVYSPSTGSARQLTFTGTVNTTDRTQCLAWSPDGREVAAVVRVGSANHIVISDATRAAEPRTLTSTMPDCAVGLSWAPDSRITYVEVPGHELRSIDPKTGQSTILTADTSLVMSNPAVDSGGRKVAFYAMSQHGSKSGLRWLEAGKSARQVSTDYVIPLAWTSDGAALLARMGNSRDIVRIEQDGRKTRVATTGARDDWCMPALPRPRIQLTCTSVTTISDAWLLELARP